MAKPSPNWIRCLPIPENTCYRLSSLTQWSSYICTEVFPCFLANNRLVYRRRFLKTPRSCASLASLPNFLDCLNGRFCPNVILIQENFHPPSTHMPKMGVNFGEEIPLLTLRDHYGPPSLLPLGGSHNSKMLHLKPVRPILSQRVHLTISIRGVRVVLSVGLHLYIFCVKANRILKD